MESQQTFFTVKDIPAEDFITAYAEFLKKNDKVKLPKWLDFVKTGKSRELAPLNPDWLYIRAASVARKIYLRGHLGIGSLKHIYGGKQRFGVTRNHHVTASKKIIRYCLQQLESIGVVKKDKKQDMKKFSRIISREGQTDLNHIATQVAQANRNKNN